jgi:hypothetical protein
MPVPERDNEERRYSGLNIGDDEFAVYDRENHQAWVQSTRSVPLRQMR